MRRLSCYGGKLTLNKRIYYTVLKERTHYDLAINSMENIAMNAGHNGYERIIMPYMRTDAARNMAAWKFLALSKDPYDTLVMLDGDHIHPGSIVEQLVQHDDKGFVGALAFRRGEPYEPMMFVRHDDGTMHAIARWTRGACIPCAMVGHAAIAIQRRVFDKLKEAGERGPWWKYEYPGGEQMPSEDMYFGKLLEKIGEPMWCDTSIITPHIILGAVDDATWDEYLQDHQELAAEGVYDLPG